MKKTIMSFEDACEALGLDATKLPEVSMLPEKHRKAIVAHYKLVIIAEASNEGWTPDWGNHREYKYYPWFNVVKKDGSGSGFGLSFDGCGVWHAFADVGSRLCFKTYQLAEYAGKQFKELYEDSYLIG